MTARKEENMSLKMDYCMACGEKLVMKYLPGEGKEIPYCSGCGDWRFPVFSTAVSMLVISPERDRYLLIRQYGRPTYVLTAGYINKGEDAEHAVRREIMEELGLKTASLRFNHSHYFAPSNTLMLNFAAVVEDCGVHPNEEVDDWKWFSEEEARRNIRPDSLAQDFLEGYFTGHYPWNEG